MPIPALELESRAASSNAKANGAAPTLWSERFAQRTQRMTSSMIRELLKLTEKPDVIEEGIRRLARVVERALVR